MASCHRVLHRAAASRRIVHVRTLLLLVCASSAAYAARAADAGRAAGASPPPRLVITILVDDLGYNDLGYTGSGVLTPHLDRLRFEGVALSSMYVQPICTPTRAAFLSSRLPLALGLQGKATVQPGQSWGLDVDEPCWPAALASAGWRTAMVGKAHVGADRWRRTPTFRGFSSFMGYLYGAEDYYNHTLSGGFDLRNDTAPSCGPGCSAPIGREYAGVYSTHVFAAEVARLVAAAGADPRPTYIHFTPQSVHAPNEAPESYVAPYRPIFGPANPVRAVHAGALAALDEAIGNVTAAVAAAGLADETLIIVCADNGGPLGTTGDGTRASNWPLRGGKHSLYSGGVLATAFAWGPAWLGAGENRSWPGLAHVVDIGATVLDAAGVPPLPPPPGRPSHGVSFWSALVAGAPASGRDDVVVNVDYTEPSQAAIVTADGWKLILGATGGSPDCVAEGGCEFWSARKTGLPEEPPPAPRARAAAPAAAAAAARPPGPAPTPSLGGAPFWPISNMTATLFNLRADPREVDNVAADHPDVVANLTARLAVWGARAVAVVENATVDPAANPAHFNGTWTPWLGM